MGLMDRLRAWRSGKTTAKAEERPPNETGGNTSERGQRSTPESGLRYLYRGMWVDYEFRAKVLDIRRMDALDGRVRRIHARVARDMVRGGLVLTQTRESRVLRREWGEFMRRLQLNRAEKLKSDACGLVMEGNLPLQWVLDEALNVVAGVRMPSETILPDVGENGQFRNVAAAYRQMDPNRGRELAVFPLWQLFLARFDPQNFDDLGSMGRPFLDASRTTWQKLTMTEEDLVIRRRHRAPLRLAHVLEGASKEELEDYQDRVEKDASEITTDFYANKKGGVTAVQGDATLGDIGDVVHLLDTFFAGTPLPKGLMGYTNEMARDILEDLKRDYYEEVDLLQDTLSYAYAQGFRLHLLLKGVAPDPDDYKIEFAQLRTETPNQTTDRMLKWQALGLPRGMIYEELGMNPQDVKARLKQEAKDKDPYPGGTGSIGARDDADDPAAPDSPAGPARIKVTPGNAPKGESATSVTHSNRLGEHWPEDE